MLKTEYLKELKRDATRAWQAYRELLATSDNHKDIIAARDTYMAAAGRVAAWNRQYKQRDKKTQTTTDAQNAREK